MIDKLQQLLRQVETWPEKAQQELVEAALEIAASLEGQYQPTSEELAGIDRGLADASQGRFAAHEQVKTAFDKFRVDESRLHRKRGG